MLFSIKVWNSRIDKLTKQVRTLLNNKCTDIWMHFSTGKGDRLGDSYKGNFVDGQVRNLLFNGGKDYKSSYQWILNSLKIKIVFRNFFLIFGRILEADFFNPVISTISVKKFFLNFFDPHFNFSKRYTLPQFCAVLLWCKSCEPFTLWSF